MADLFRMEKEIEAFGALNARRKQKRSRPAAKQKGLYPAYMRAVPKRRDWQLAVPVSFTVPGKVPVLKQPKRNACWAAVFTILNSWKENRSLGIEDSLAMIGRRWVDIYHKDTGLYPKDNVDFAAETGLVSEPPQNFTVEGWENLLRTYGPIWVTTDEAPGKPWALHARIITGIQGDGTPEGTTFSIIDPGTGTRYKETIAVFIPKYEEEVVRTGFTRIQVIHYPKDARVKSNNNVQAKSAYGSSSLTKGLGDTMAPADRHILLAVPRSM